MSDTRHSYIRFFVILAVLCIILVYIQQFSVLNISARIKSSFPSWISKSRDSTEAYKIQYNLMLSNYCNRLNWTHKPRYGDKSLYVDTWSTPHQSSSSQPKLILLWTPFFGKRDWLTNSTFLNCSVSNCLVTTDKKELGWSHAVIFHSRDVSENRPFLPSVRQPFQRWMYLSLESPWHTPRNRERFDGLLNWTASFRRDTDLTVYKGEMRRREIPLDTVQLESRIDAIVSNKTKLIAARISNCHTPHSKRLQYVKELSKYLPVHFYGGCGNMKCPRGKKGDEIMKEYKFYLSFENSNCRDYITEKFWFPLSLWNSVPVVMGGASPLDYTAVAPNTSFIHVSGYSSPKSLAEFIQLLDRHDDLYRSYFTWHRDWQVHPRDWCPLCSMLNNKSLKYQTYRDFKGWYKQDICI